MDVLQTLKDNGQTLYPEDLDFFETELATGAYAPEYIKACKELMKEIRSWQGDKDGTVAMEDNALPGNILITPSGLMPGGQAEPLSDDEIFAEVRAHVVHLRNLSDYKSSFKRYIAECPHINEAFVDAHFSFFQPWEMGALVSAMPLSEAFLEKYITVLDAEKVARYQQFSEQFFMKHYGRFDVGIVLEQGRNEWREKEKRSSQLDVFLRLKGVRVL